MFPSTFDLFVQISKKQPAIIERSSGWAGMLSENLRLIGKILDTLYEFVYDAADPSVKNLEALQNELNSVRRLIREDIVALDRNLASGELEQLPPNWRIFVSTIKNSNEADFLDLLESLRIYIQLVKAKSTVISRKNFGVSKKDSQRSSKYLIFLLNRVKEIYTHLTNC
jgi:hypothetical protein